MSFESEPPCRICFKNAIFDGGTGKSTVRIKRGRFEIVLCELVEDEMEHVKFPKISVGTPFEISIDPGSGPVKIIAEKSHVIKSLEDSEFEKITNPKIKEEKCELSRKRPGRPIAYPEIEERLKKWVAENSEKLSVLSAKAQKQDIKEKAMSIATDLSKPNFVATDFWLKSFTKRCDELKESGNII